MVAVLGPDYRFLDFNRAYAERFRRISGVRIERGTDIRQALEHMPVHRERAVSFWQRALEGEAFDELVPVLDSPDREPRYWEMSYRPLPGDMDQEGAYLLLRDATERELRRRDADQRRTQGLEEELDDERRALAVERSRLRAVLDLLPVGVWIADADGRIVETNRGAAEIWGGPLPDSDDPLRYHEKYRGWWPSGEPVEDGEWGLARAVVAGEASGPEEVVIETVDGERKTILNYGVPIRNAAGAIEGGVALSVDVTDRVRTERALRRSNERLELLLSAARGLLAAKRPREFMQAMFEDVSEHLGVTYYFNYLVVEEGLMRLDSAGGIEAEARRELEHLEFGRTVCGRVAETRIPAHETDVQSSDDEATALIRGLGVTAYACFPLLAGGDLVGTLSFGRTVEERFDEDELDLLAALADQVAVAVQRERVRKSERTALERAEAANRAKSGFMATVSHELRTPINAVIGYTDLLMEGIPEPINEPARMQVERISHGARHLRQLIEEILTFSRIEAGRESVEKDALSTADLLDEVSAVIEPLARGKGLKLVLVDDEAPETIVTDSRKLRQILVNLLGNAVKFTDEGEVRLEICGRGRIVLFQVSDTGRGIEPEQQEQLFEPFWQGSEGYDSAGGTGLGLTISVRYAAMLDGRLTVESEPGRGSTFTLVLPADAEAGVPPLR